MWTEDELDLIRMCGRAAMSKKELWDILEPNTVAKELDIGSGDAHRIYWAERMKAKVELRTAIMTLAVNGSGPAQALAHGMFQDLEHGEA